MFEKLSPKSSTSASFAGIQREPFCKIGRMVTVWGGMRDWFSGNPSSATVSPCAVICMEFWGGPSACVETAPGWILRATALATASMAPGVQWVSVRRNWGSPVRRARS